MWSFFCGQNSSATCACGSTSATVTGASIYSCNAPSAYAGSSYSTAASYSAICIDCSCTATVYCLATNACGTYSATALCSLSYSGDSYAVIPCPAGTTDSTETRVSEIA